MREVVVFPDVVSWAVDYLADAFEASGQPYADDVHVGSVVPDSRHSRMVIIRRDGGPRLDVVRESARLGVRVWAANDADANDLTNLTRAYLAASPGEGPVKKFTEIAGPSAIADESNQPLRFFSVELIIRGSAL